MNETKPTANLTAIQSISGWSVRCDLTGARWWPDDETRRELVRTNAGEGEVLRLVTQEPMRGTWQD